MQIDRIAHQYEEILSMEWLSVVNIEKESTEQLVKKLLYLDKLLFSHSNIPDDDSGAKIFHCKFCNKLLWKIIFHEINESKDIVISKFVTINFKTSQWYRIQNNELHEIAATLSTVSSQKWIWAKMLFEFFIFLKRNGYKNITFQSERSAEGFYNTFLHNLKENGEIEYIKKDGYYSIRL